MSLFVLDTDIVSLYQHDHPVVCSNVQKHPLSELAISVLTVEEQLSGWYNELRKAKKPAALAAVYQRMAQRCSFSATCQFFHSRSPRSAATKTSNG